MNPFDSSDPLWDKLGNLPLPSPGDESHSHQQFNLRLQAYADGYADGSQSAHRTQTAHDGSANKTKVTLFAAWVGMTAAVCMGLLHMLQLQNQHSLQQELRSLRQLWVESQLQQISPAARVASLRKATDWISQDSRLIAPFLQTLNSDASVNARLSALDGLSSSLGSATMRTILLQSVPLQDSQIVKQEILRHLKASTPASQWHQVRQSLHVLDPAALELLDHTTQAPTESYPIL